MQPVFHLSELVARLGGQWRGQDVVVQRVAPLDSADAEAISFLSNPKYRQQLDCSAAAAVIVSERTAADLAPERNLIVAADPYLYFAQVARLFHPVQAARASVHATAVIEAGASVPASCEIGAHVYIGADVVLGEACRILAGCVVEAGCVLGDGVLLHPNVTLYPHTVLGQRVEIHAGSVIGADGFGLAWDKANNEWFKIPQTGRVVVGDGVEIGANSCIDRGALDDTVIGAGVKIDNLVQIAHNVHIGAHTAIAACVGISGSTRIGAYCTIGGAAMFVGHITVADKTFVGGGTLVSHSLKEAGHYASSYPLQSHKDWTRNAVHVRHLNEMNKRIKSLEQHIHTLSGSLKDGETTI